MAEIFLNCMKTLHPQTQKKSTNPKHKKCKKFFLSIPIYIIIKLFKTYNKTFKIPREKTLSMKQRFLAETSARRQ